MVTVTVEQYDVLILAITAAQSSDLLPIHISAMLVDRPRIDGTDITKDDSQWIVGPGILTYKGRIYVPAIGSLQR